MLDGGYPMLAPGVGDACGGRFRPILMQKKPGAMLDGSGRGAWGDLCPFKN